MSNVSNVPEDRKPGWMTGYIRLRNPGLGVTVEYGLTPAGFDGVVLTQDRGGVVITPFFEMNGKLRIGVIEQARPLQQREGVVLNVPRGFSGDQKKILEARRELVEEVGIRPELIIALEGQPTNGNSTFLDTSGSDQGDQYFGVWLTHEHVVLVDGVWRLRPELIRTNTAHKVAERIGQCRFILWEEAVGLADTFTIVAAARVRTYVEGVYAAAQKQK